MNIWLITVGEPLPCDAGGRRLLRTGMLAERCAAVGHEVTWWTSSFDHTRKQHRTTGDEWFDAAPNYRVRLLRSTGYRRNVSWQRLRDHRGLARSFARQAPQQPRPNVILCSLPTLELCDEALRFGRQHGIPVVLDVRDLWPDVFLDWAPPLARPLVQQAVRPLRRLAQRACSGATAIVGITERFVDWGVTHAGRRRNSLDRVFPMAYRERKPSTSAIESACDDWRSLGIARDSEDFICCFFGSINRHFEIPTIIEAARVLDAEQRRVKFVLCGDGDRLDEWKQLAADCPSVLFPGWVDADRIWTLMRLASAGLAPYVSSRNFVGNLPNKPIEYLSAGLPILSSLQGTLADLLERHDCGITYGNRDASGLAAVVRRLMDEPAERRRMAENAARLYRAEFVAETVYREMGDYLVNVAATRSAAVPPFSRRACPARPASGAAKQSRSTRSALARRTQEEDNCSRIT